MVGFHFGISRVGVDDHVLDQPQRRRGREDVSPAREILFQDVVLHRAGELRLVGALLLGERRIEREQPGGRGVDGHRGVHLGERDALEQAAHVAEMRDRHADFADLAARQRVVGVVAGLGRQIEGDREPGLALGEVPPVKLVGGRSPWNGRHRCGTARACPAWVSFRSWSCSIVLLGLHRSTLEGLGQPYPHLLTQSQMHA